MLVEHVDFDHLGRPRIGAVILGYLTMPPPAADPERWAYDVMYVWQGRQEDLARFEVRFLAEHSPSGTHASARMEQEVGKHGGRAGCASLKLPAKLLAPAPGRVRLDAAVTAPPGGGSWLEYDVHPFGN